MKKKLLYGLFVFVLVLGLVGCGSNNTNTTNDNGDDNNTTEDGGKKYSYTDGVLTQTIDDEGNPTQTDFIIDGIILVGNRHEYSERTDTMGTIEYFAKQGYKKSGINSSFYLGEWIEMYIDTKYSGSTNNVKILAVPHASIESYEKLSYSKLEEIATENGGFVIDYQEPDKENYKYVGNGYIHQDYKEGKYDLLFTYKGKIAYFIELSLTKEWEE